MQIFPHSLSTDTSAVGTERNWRWRGWTINYKFYGPQSPNTPSLPPLLLIHGFGSSANQWYRNLLPLGRQRRVYALDLLGFGASEKGAIAYNGDLWVAQIYDFWQQFIGQPMVLVGHSLGALMAATVAVNHPETVQRLVLVTLPNTRQDMVQARWVQATVGPIERIFASPLLVRLIFHIARQPGFIRKALTSIYMKRDRVTDEVVSHFVTPTLDRGAAQTLCRLTQAATRPNYSLSRERLLQSIQQPTLVLWGQHDRVVPLKPCQADIKANSNLTLVTIPGGGHCVYDECADDFNQELLEWLKLTETTSSTRR
ncbi:MAG: alpha/beta fold hydrolase [Cyanobacteria bacterium P01_F01_bin.150]